jgi:hypothetical protein
MNDGIIYLASPYSHPDVAVRLDRFRQACKVAGLLMNKGMIVFSPIAHTAPVADECNLPLGWDFWEKYDRAFLSVCSAMYVLTIEGWSKSVGVLAEIGIAKELNLPILLVDINGVVRDLHGHVTEK